MSSNTRLLQLVLAGSGGAVVGTYCGLWLTHRSRMRRALQVRSCCGGTGYADYAAVPCANPSCPERR